MHSRNYLSQAFGLGLLVLAFLVSSYNDFNFLLISPVRLGLTRNDGAGVIFHSLNHVPCTDVQIPLG